MEQKRARSKVFMVWVGFMIACCIGLLCQSVCVAADGIVAIVNNDIITKKDLEDFLNFMRFKLQGEYPGAQLEEKIRSMQSDLLDSLIEDRLIVQEAVRAQVTLNPTRVSARLEEIKKRYPSIAAFREALARQGLTQADMEKKIKEELFKYVMVEEKVKKKIVVNPTEVTQFFNDHLDEFKVPESKEFKIVTTDDELLGYEFYKKVKEGQAFDEAASVAGLRVNDLCISQKGQLRKEVEDAALRLQLGEISEPVKIEDKYHIFKLERIVAARSQPFSEVKDSIFSYLYERKMQEKLLQWLEELKQRSYIKKIGQ